MPGTFAARRHSACVWLKHCITSDRTAGARFDTDRAAPSSIQSVNLTCSAGPGLWEQMRGRPDRASPHGDAPARGAPWRGPNSVACFANVTTRSPMTVTFAVRTIPESSAGAAYAIVVLAFGSDPAARWSWPRAGDFLRNLPLLARAFAGKAFALRSASGARLRPGSGGQASADSSKDRAVTSSGDSAPS